MNKNKFLSLVGFAFLLSSPSISFGDDVSVPPVVAPGQPAAVTGTTAVTDPAAAPAAANLTSSPSSTMGMFLPMIVLFGFMYFAVIRPQKKRMKQQQDLISGLKAGDEVITASGIIGTITGLEDQVAKIEIAKGVQIKVVKSQVNQLVSQMVAERPKA